MSCVPWQTLPGNVLQKLLDTDLALSLFLSFVSSTANHKELVSDHGSSSVSKREVSLWGNNPKDTQ